MFGVVLFAVTVVAASAAPALVQGELPQKGSEKYQPVLREKRSSYPLQYYAPAPCASAQIPSYFAPPPPHHYAPPPLPHYGVPLPHYRDADEFMSFSDAEAAHDMSQHFMSELPEHMMSRYAYAAPAIPALPLPVPHYGPGAIASGLASVSGGPGPSGPAIGVFPNANVGGCSIPLLLSCSPSIRPGHIVKSHEASYAGEAYRGVDDPQQIHDPHQDLSHHALMTPSHEDAAVAPTHQ